MFSVIRGKEKPWLKKLNWTSISFQKMFHLLSNTLLHCGDGETKGSRAEFWRDLHSCADSSAGKSVRNWSCDVTGQPCHGKPSLSLAGLYLWVVTECFLMMQAVPNELTACICGVVENKHTLSGPNSQQIKSPPNCGFINALLSSQQHSFPAFLSVFKTICFHLCISNFCFHHQKPQSRPS